MAISGHSRTTVISLGVSERQMKDHLLSYYKFGFISAGHVHVSGGI